MICDGCGEPENDYRILYDQQINQGEKERIYHLCDTCVDKIVRIIEGQAL